MIPCTDTTNPLYIPMRPSDLKVLTRQSTKPVYCLSVVPLPTSAPNLRKHQQKSDLVSVIITSTFDLILKVFRTNKIIFIIQRFFMARKLDSFVKNNSLKKMQLLIKIRNRFFKSVWIWCQNYLEWTNDLKKLLIAFTVKLMTRNGNLEKYTLSAAMT